MKQAKLKQSFGKVKLFEIRRLVRRIRQLSLKKGSEQQLAKNKRKISRLEDQLEILKDARFEKIMEILDKNEADQALCEEKDDAKTLVLSKLTNAVQIERKQLEKFEEERQKKRIGKSKVISNSTDSSEDEGLESSLSLNNKTKHPLRMKKMKRKGKESSEKKKREQVIVELDISDNDAYISSDDEDQFDRKHLSVDSVFIGSLSNGKQSRDGKRDGKSSKNKSKDFKRKGNRLGQRKRREQWLKLYGKTANHLKTENRKDKMNERKKQSNSSQGNGSFSKKMKNKIAVKKTPVLHPSWEASKSKRKQENIVAFEGQKITFDE